MATKNKTANKRSTFLSIWLVLIIIVNVINFLVNVFEYSSLVHNRGFTGGEVIALAIINLLEIVGALLIWKWYKSGLYLVILCAVAGFFAYPTLSRSLSSIFYSFIGIIILYLAMRSTWRRFR